MEAETRTKPDSIPVSVGAHEGGSPAADHPWTLTQSERSHSCFPNDASHAFAQATPRLTWLAVAAAATHPRC